MKIFQNLIYYNHERPNFSRRYGDCRRNAAKPPVQQTFSDYRGKFRPIDKLRFRQVYRERSRRFTSAVCKALPKDCSGQQDQIDPAGAR